jgi:hypothetical protein
MKGYVFSASDYNKIWYYLKKQMRVVVLCKTSTYGVMCYFLLSLSLLSHHLSLSVPHFG